MRSIPKPNQHVIGILSACINTHQILKKFIHRFEFLEKDALGQLQAKVQVQHLAKKDILIKPGTVAEHLYYIETGALRSYLIKDGDDLSDYFFLEESFVTDFASYFGQKPSPFFLEALEPTTLYRLRRADLISLGRQFPKIETFQRILAEKAFVEIEERMRLLHHASLEERYTWLLQKIPEVMQRVPQYHVASYLGVKPESLSRIKKMMTQKDRDPNLGQ